MAVAPLTAGVEGARCQQRCFRSVRCFLNSLKQINCLRLFTFVYVCLAKRQDVIKWFINPSKCLGTDRARVAQDFGAGSHRVAHDETLSTKTPKLLNCATRVFVQVRHSACSSHSPWPTAPQPSYSLALARRQPPCDACDALACHVSSRLLGSITGLEKGQ